MKIRLKESELPASMQRKNFYKSWPVKRQRLFNELDVPQKWELLYNASTRQKN